MTFIKGEHATDVLPTAVLHKYLNDELKILCLLQFFTEVAQNSLSFPCSEKSLSIPGFPGLWPPWLIILQHIMRPSIARASEKLDPQCSVQTYHRPNQLH